MVHAKQELADAGRAQHQSRCARQPAFIRAQMFAAPIGVPSGKICELPVADQRYEICRLPGRLTSLSR